MSDSSKKPDKPAPTPTPASPKPGPNLYSVEQKARKPGSRKPQAPKPSKAKPDSRLRSIVGRYETPTADRRLKSVESKVMVVSKPVRRTVKGRKSSK